MQHRVSDLFHLQMGKTPSRDQLEYWENGSNKWISISDLSNCSMYTAETKEAITDCAVRETNIRLVPKNTVIMSFKLSIGKTAITSEPVYTNEAIMAFINKGEELVLPEFLYYQLLSKDWGSAGNRAVMGATLNKASLSQMKINVPSLQEQQGIVQVLSQIDSQLKKADESVNKLDDLVKSRFVEMFGDITEQYLLGERLETTSGGTPSRKHPEYYEGGSIPWLTSGEVNKGKIDTPDHFITEAGLRNSSAKLVPANSVVVAMYGATAGQVGLVTYETTTNQAVCCIKPNAQVVPVFLRYALEFRKDWMINQCAGGAQPNISQGIVKKVAIPDVTQAKQQDFADFVTQVDKLRFATQQQIDKLETLKKSLMQEYFG